MRRPSKYAGFVLLLAGLALASACSADAGPGPGPSQTPAPSQTGAVGPVADTATASILAAGEFQLPAASSFGDPGFHAILFAKHDLPAGLGSVAGKRLVLKLWDAGRPERNCGSEHPLSGCATVDWSDAPGRPNVPSGGVFENSITLQIGASERRYYLSETGEFQDTPEAFDPG